MDRSKLYKKTIKKWGIDSQMGMLSEECGELISNINKWIRGRVGANEILEELVDVEIMVEQIKTFFAYPTAKEFFKSKKQEKLKRIKERLDGSIECGDGAR